MMIRPNFVPNSVSIFVGTLLVRTALKSTIFGRVEAVMKNSITVSTRGGEEDL